MVTPTEKLFNEMSQDIDMDPIPCMIFHVNMVIFVFDLIYIILQSISMNYAILMTLLEKKSVIIDKYAQNI